MASPVVNTGITDSTLPQVQSQTLEDKVKEVFKENGLELTSLKEGEMDGRSVIVIDMTEKTRQQLEENPGLLLEVKNGLECCVGAGVGICIGLWVAIGTFAPFAIAGGVCLGIGKQRLADNDPTNDNQAQELVTAGTWVLASGGILAGLEFIAISVLAGLGICFTSN